MGPEVSAELCTMWGAVGALARAVQCVLRADARCQPVEQGRVQEVQAAGVKSHFWAGVVREDLVLLYSL